MPKELVVFVTTQISATHTMPRVLALSQAPNWAMGKYCSQELVDLSGSMCHGGFRRGNV